MKGKIFNAQEVQSILNGSKVMFREVIKPQPKEGDAFLFDDKGQIVFQKDCCPYQVGQKIFCKESWNAFSGETLGTPLGRMRLYSYPPKQGDTITYKADADLTKDFTTYLPSRIMPQWASRITLQIKSIGVERLQDIKEDGAKKEGFAKTFEAFPRANVIDETTSAYGNFIKFWNATHKKPEEKWEANPFVFCFSYEVVR